MRARLFSALFLEALKIGEDQAFYELATHPDFVLSDAFPFVNGNTLPTKTDWVPRSSRKSAERSLRSA